jgi:BirA family transcriptional regulator, biotin operon repressor / biotin---[acetyl-CoA-carboxylase] ligase
MSIAFMNSTLEKIDIAALLATGLVATVEHHEELGSTQDRAFELARQSSSDGPVLVIADRQTAGRGRGRNSWWTGAGSLAFSLVLDPRHWDLPYELLPQRSLTTAVAIVDTLQPLLPGCMVGFHWPNDVFVGQHKIAGVLIDVLPDGRHIFGVGLNVNNTISHAPLEVRYRATTLFDLTARMHCRTALLSSLLTNLKLSLSSAADSPEAMTQRFQALCLQIGSELIVDSGQSVIAGTCIGIAVDGALELSSSDGLQRIYSGTVRNT